MTSPAIASPQVERRPRAADRPAWPASPVAEVFAEVGAFVLGRAAAGRQRQLLATALAGLDQHAAGTEALFFVDLPLLVHGAIRGDERPAIPLAVATTLLFLGADILDDLADGDRPAHWHGCSPAEINLAGATLLCALTPLAIGHLRAPADCVLAMQETLASGLLRMGAGQQSDLAGIGGGHVRADEIEAAVAGKSGEELAIFATLAAQLAGAPAGVVEHYAAMGRAVGTGAQLASDCYELFTDPASRDLAHGTPTLPTALRLERLRGGARAAFADLLDRARTAEAAREEVRRQLRAGGELRQCAFIVEIHRQRALRQLALAVPLEPAASGLRALIDRISFFPQTIAGPTASGAQADMHRNQTREEPKSHEP